MTRNGPFPGIFRALAVALVVAGCLDANREPPATSEPSPTVSPITFVQTNNATSCTRVFPAIPVDRAHAQTFLPDGFVAAEASTFFGQPTYPANTGLLIVSAMRCAASDWSPDGYVEAMIGVFVAPPMVDDAPLEGEHFYELGRAAPDNQPYAGTLGQMGWNMVGDLVDVMHQTTPTHGGSLTIGDPNGTVFAASVAAAPAKDDFTGTLHLRWWQRTDQGHGFFEYVFAPNGYLGPGTCDARPGSVAAQILESTRCPEALFMVGPPYDVKGRFEFQPD